MTRLLRSETLKLTTTRVLYALAVSLVAVVALFTALQLAFANREDLTDQGEIVGVLPLTTFFALVLGILIAGGEYRHATISQTFLAEPRRERVLAAKVLVGLATGLTLAALAAALALAIAFPWTAARDVPFSFSNGGVVRMVLGALAASSLWGGLGVAVGAALTNQVGALVATTAYIFIVESLLQALVPEVGRFLPGGAVNALTGGAGAGDDLPVWTGALLSLGYLAVATAVAAVVTLKRDVA